MKRNSKGQFVSARKSTARKPRKPRSPAKSRSTAKPQPKPFGSTLFLEITSPIGVNLGGYTRPKGLSNKKRNKIKLAIWTQKVVEGNHTIYYTCSQETSGKNEGLVVVSVYDTAAEARETQRAIYNNCLKSRWHKPK